MTFLLPDSRPRMAPHQPQEHTVSEGRARILGFGGVGLLLLREGQVVGAELKKGYLIEHIAGLPSCVEAWCRASCCALDLAHDY